MKIEPHTINVRQLVDGYRNNDEEGVVAFGGKLDVRPKYQREFIYSDAEQKAVIDTVTKGYPLNVMYWAVRGDGTYEVMDGQQRTLSICQFCDNEFSMEFELGIPRMFGNLLPDQRQKILDYKILVYICKGSQSEKLEWFRIINVAQQPLTEQELLNANYTGRWLTDAKKKFSKTNCVAYKKASNFMTGTPIRQDYLETVLTWITNVDRNKVFQFC